MAQWHDVFLRTPVRISYRWVAPSVRQRAKCLTPPLTQRLYYSVDKRPAPSKTKRNSKVYNSADEAIADVEDGTVILSAGFGLCGVAGTEPSDR